MLRLECLCFSLVGALILSLSTALQPAMEQWEAGRRSDDGVLAALFGESRRLFATHYFIKADAYFHSGYYPTIFDQKDGKEAEIHIAEQAGGAAEEEEEEHDFEGPARDWIDRLGRQFRPNRHTHLGGESGGVETHKAQKDHDTEAKEEGHEAEHHDHEEKEAPKELEREILPWLRLSASLDPQRIQTYVVGAYYLRTMGKPDQAERFLREGFRTNPQSYEILMELGKLCSEVHRDSRRARNFWEASLRFWKTQELPKPVEERNVLGYATLLGNLAKLEESDSDFKRAMSYLQELQPISPNKESITKWMAEVQAKLDRPPSR